MNVIRLFNKSRLKFSNNFLTNDWLIIAGSHDSFSASLTPSSDVAPNCPAFVRDLVRVFGTAGKQFVYKWSVTQSLDLKEQLMIGVRYIDLRVSAKTGTDKLYFSHGLYGRDVASEMEEVAQFLNEHPTEIIFLDYNHFYNLSIEQHQGLQKLLLDVFGDKLVPVTDMNNISLKRLWKSHLQVFVFYHDEAIAYPEVFWPAMYIPSPWANTYSTKKLLEFLEKSYIVGRPKDTFYVTQGVLTPDGHYVFKHLFSSLRKTLCGKAVAAFVQWLETKRAGPQGVNICILDYVELDSYIPSVIELNLKLLGKPKLLPHYTDNNVNPPVMSS